MQRIIARLTLPLIPLAGFAQEMLPDHHLWRPNGIVQAIAIDSANNVAYIGGQFTSLTDPDPPFTSVTRNNAAAIDLATGEPLPWNPSPNYNVMCMVITASAVFLGGAFTSVGGQPRSCVAAVDKNTGIALNWSTVTINGAVWAMAIESNKVFVGGKFLIGLPQVRQHAAAFSLSTGALEQWDPSPSSRVMALLPLNGGIYMGGLFTTLANGLQSSPYLAFVTSESGAPMSTVAAPNEPVRALATAYGRLYVGGEFTEVGGVPRSHAAALIGGGSYVHAWNPAPNWTVNALVKMGAHILMGGDFALSAGSKLATVDATTGTVIWTQMNSLNAQPQALAAINGSILAGGGFSTCMSFEMPGLTRLTPAPPLVRVRPRVFLGGCYVSAELSMHDSLRRAALVPQTEPYGAMGYPYTAGGAPGTIPTSVMSNAAANQAVVDWVVVELREAANPSVVAASKRGVLFRDGSVMDVNRVSPLWLPVPPGSYHVAVRHRNHLGVMTAMPVALSATSSTVDFTLSGFTPFGTGAMNTVGTRNVLWPGDATRNGIALYVGNGNDRDPILLAIGGSTPTSTLSNVYSPLDVNMDGVIKYVGANNDRDPILTTVGGSTPTNTRTQQLP